MVKVQKCLSDLSGFLEASQRSTELIFYTCAPKPWTQAERLLPAPEDPPAPGRAIQPSAYGNAQPGCCRQGFELLMKEMKYCHLSHGLGSSCPGVTLERLRNPLKTYIKNNSVRELQLGWVEFKCYTFATYKMPEFKLYLNLI